MLRDRGRKFPDVCRRLELTDEPCVIIEVERPEEKMTASISFYEDVIIIQACTKVRTNKFIANILIITCNARLLALTF